MRINKLLLNKYRIEKLISQGSFSTVFRATEQLIKRTVAIKVIPRSVYTGNRIRYFFTELRALGMNWGHPNIVSIHTVEPGDDEYVAYMVMEFVDGIDLQRMLSNNPPSLGLAVSIAIDICSGLSVAHQSNIIHRDIKPQNILLNTDFQAKISDFGVARILEESNDFAATVTGTRKYMSPEQYDGNYDLRADLYATGLIIYEMFVHRYPFSGQKHEEIKRQKLAGKLQMPPDLDPILVRFLNKALSPDPRHRFQTANEMKDELFRIRSQKYTEVASQIITNQSKPADWHDVLSMERNTWKIPAEVAKKVEFDLWYQKADDANKSETSNYSEKVHNHYNRANQQNSVNALKEIKQAALLGLNDLETIRIANKTFNKLLDIVEQQSREITSEELLNVIQKQPKLIQRQIADQLGSKKETTSIPEKGASLQNRKSLHPHQSFSPQSFSPKTPQVDEDRNPGYVLQTMHQSVQYAHENEAKRILSKAIIYSDQGRVRPAQKSYKELGDFYSQQARSYSERGDFSIVANCYSRAYLAYQSASKLRFARRSAHLAGDHYTQVAIDLEKGREWLPAGQMYEQSGLQYTNANQPDKANDSWSRGTICYFNYAENEHSKGKLTSAYKYCQHIISIGREMLTPSYAVAGATRLMKDINNNGQFVSSPSTVPGI